MLLGNSSEPALIVGLIGARSGSKGVPNKNIRLLGGYPLLAWSVRACKRAHLIDRTIVSTDSEEYAAIARLYGAEVIMRPAEISGDESTDYEFIAHALETVDCEYIAHIRPTTPLRDPYHFTAAMDLFLKNPQHTSMRSVHEMPESAYKTFEIDGGVLKGVGAPLTGNFDLDLYNNGRQSFAKTYAANGYIDLLRVDYIRRSGNLHGDKVLPLITPFYPEIDTEADFDYLEWRIANFPQYVERIFG
jgi:CMP-N,N'-diacetyllegionaminic acid synthase